jgi:hypothetical protein
MSDTATTSLTRESLSNLLLTNDRAVERALVALFERQTEGEQVTNATRVSNGVGFSMLDADIFSSFAKQVQTRGFLSPKQLEVCRKLNKAGTPRIGKYWAQLADIAKERALKAAA